MRCEECLAVVEEYFDGELEREKGERVAAHLSACADCAAAHDALAFEQELFLRYDRGLEVTPALWEGVRASVARLEESEKAARPLPPFAGLRQRLAAAFGALAPRAAFAPALALVLLGAAVGALWLARRPAENRAPEVAGRTTPAGREESPAPPRVAPADPEKNFGGVSEAEPRDREPARIQAAGGGRAGMRIVNAGGASADASRGAAAAADAAAPPDPDHLAGGEADVLPPSRPAPAEPEDVVIASASARLPTPEEKEMARHLEQAQMLLRSFQNEVAEGGDAVRLAYERRLSRKLLEENATLQLEAEASGDKQTRRVLDTLEPFLLDIANLRDNASRDEVRSINERMQKKEIIASLHVF